MSSMRRLQDLLNTKEDFKTFSDKYKEPPRDYMNFLARYVLNYFTYYQSITRQTN